MPVPQRACAPPQPVFVRLPARAGAALPFHWLRILPDPGLRQILALKGIDLIRVGGSPFQRLGQPGATIQEIGLAAAGCPILGGFGEVAVQAQIFTVVFKPAAQGGPLADQCFVRDLSRVLAGDDQAGIGKGFQHILR